MSAYRTPAHSIVKVPCSLTEPCPNSQRYQADLLKFAIERYRRHKYTEIGSLFQFMFMDCWPSITWSVLSYDRVPKLGYRALQDAYQPVLVGADIRREKVLLGRDLGSHDRPFQVACWLVNDRHEALVDCQLNVQLQRDGVAPVSVSMALPVIHADCVAELGTITLALPPDLPLGQYELALTVRRQDQEISCNRYSIEVVGTGLI